MSHRAQTGVVKLVSVVCVTEREMFIRSLYPLHIFLWVIEKALL